MNMGYTFVPFWNMLFMHPVVPFVPRSAPAPNPRAVSEPHRNRYISSQKVRLFGVVLPIKRGGSNAQAKSSIPAGSDQQ